MALYIRMFIGMAVSLYTSRVILEVLGVEDFGVYNVVGGVVSLFSFLNASMAGATSRFITYELGRGSEGNLKSVFNSALAIHIVVALIIIVLSETVGLWLLYNKLVIPSNSFTAAFWVFQFSVLGAAVSITQVPYTADLIAHEKMGIFATIDISNICLKLAIVYILIVIPGNKLIDYALLLLFSNCLISFIYRIYCIRHYKETELSYAEVDWKTVLSMCAFSGWDLYGNFSWIGRTQGVNILVNMFFGAIASAAVGISNQVQGALTSFSNSITLALKPQIIKSYVVRDFQRLRLLVYFGSKVTFISLLYITLPLLSQTHYVLSLWLIEVPEYTVEICQCIILNILFSCFATVSISGVHATGDIKGASFINGTVYLLVVPITYIAYKSNGSIYIPFILNVITVFICGIANFYYIGRYVEVLSTINYFYSVILRCVFTAGICILVISRLMNFTIGLPDYANLVLSIIYSLVIVSLFGYYICLTKTERVNVLKILRKRLKR